MTRSRWTRIKALFEQAVDLDEAARPAFLDAACAGDAALRAEVEALLAADAAVEAEAFLTAADALPPLDPDRLEDPPAAHRLGRRIGAYRLIRVLGQGGMGTVYLAERADGAFDQRVALKLVRTGPLSDELHRRFHTERQILARLNHPHIARLYDGGLTEDGTPYLVMEYVDGRPLTDAAPALDLDARLDLFITACRAVHYAHQNLVIHRDLKPSNILVTAHPGSDPARATVKLLDFGIARLMDDEAEAMGGTRTGLQPLTPAYASPEQIRGAPVSTVSDVYSLGVILYELLTGRRPYEVRGLTPSETERVICLTEPARPSTVWRQTAPRPAMPGRRRRLAGDLDTICLKALRKEPAHRYASAEALADDLARYRAGLPVTARPATLPYRLWMFARRHRTAVAAALLVGLTLVGGIVATARQARIAEAERQRAERRFADVRALAGTMLFDLDRVLADLPGTTAAREQVVRQALTYLDRLAAEPGNDPALLLELAAAYRKVGDIQGNPVMNNLGDTGGALTSYHRARTLANAARTLGAPDRAALQAHAAAAEGLADVQAFLGRLDSAALYRRQATDGFRRLAHAHPDAADARIDYAVSLIKLGDLEGNENFPNRNDPEAAQAAYREAAALLERLHAAHPDLPRAERLHGLVYERLGTIYQTQQADSLALAAYTRSLQLRQAFAARYPGHLDGQRDLAVAREKIGTMHRRAGRLAEARLAYDAAHAVYERLLRADPDNANARQTVAVSHLHRGDVLGSPFEPNLGRPAAARAAYDAALTILDDLHRADTANTHIRFLQTITRRRLDALNRPGADR